MLNIYETDVSLLNVYIQIFRGIKCIISNYKLYS